MEEIKVGEYIRLDDGTIGKLIPYDNGIKIRITEIDTWKPTIESIKKHSFNIIDLIESGDYVNGYKVKYVCNKEPCPSGKYVDVDCELDSSESYFFDNEIKSIVTKEQFNQVKYEV